LISDVDTLKIEYDIAVEMSLPPDACHNSCDSIVKYCRTAHSADGCLEFDTIKDDTREKSSGDLSDYEIEGEIPSPPLNGKKSSRMQAFMELMGRNIVDGEVSTFEVSPDDTIDIKIYPDHKDVQFDEKGEKSSAVDSQKEAVLQSLGRELNCTLAEYQTSYDVSTSGDRVEQLNYMNDLVVAIAKVSGLRIEHTNKAAPDQCELKSWSYKKLHYASSEREAHERKRSKKKKKKKTRRHHGNKRNAKTMDGLDKISSDMVHLTIH